MGKELVISLLIKLGLKTTISVFKIQIDSIKRALLNTLMPLSKLTSKLLRYEKFLLMNYNL